SVEGLMTQTGINADHRLRVPTSAVLAVTAAIAAKIVDDPQIKALAGKFPLPANVKAEWIAECANDLKANQGASLVMAGYRQAQNIVRLGYYEDETFPASEWHFPQAHYLETWGDARTSDGTVVSIQPLIAPLFGGVSELELLAIFAGLTSTRPYDIVRETFRT